MSFSSTPSPVCFCCSATILWQSHGQGSQQQLTVFNDSTCISIVYECFCTCGSGPYESTQVNVHKYYATKIWLHGSSLINKIRSMFGC